MNSRAALTGAWKLGARVLGLVLALVGAISCSDRGTPADLVFINGAEPETLDPAIMTAQVDMRISSSLFEGLTRIDKAGRPEAGIAERWDISPDGTRYTFYLREGAKWQNGDPVTASDFVTSWQRVLDPNSGASYVALLYVVKNARAYTEATLTDFSQVGVRATDDLTLEVELENPTPYFLDLCAFITLAPVHSDALTDQQGDWFRAGKLIGNGPYQLVDWRLNERIRIERNPLYWDHDNVSINTIDIRPVSEPNTAMNFFLTGEVDLIMDKGMIPNTMVDALRKKPYFHSDNFLGTYFTRFNVTRPPFDDPLVRRAFAKAIDRTRITEKITRLGEKTAYSLVPPGTGDNYQPPRSDTEFDPEGARALFAEAGYPDGRGFPLVEYLYMAKSVETHIAVELKSMWQETLGVNISLTKQEAKVYYTSMRQLSYDFCRSSWVGDYNDPSTFLDMFVSGGGNNRTGYESVTYDQLIADAAAQPDPVQRYQIFQKAERLLISEDAVIMPIYYYVGVQFYRPDEIGGIQTNVVDNHPLREIYRIEK